MNLVDDILKRAQAEPRNLPVGGMAALLGSSDEGAWETVRAAAYELKAREVGRKVNLRGLVECSNVCAKDCRYCGIRKGNAAVARYRIPEDEVAVCIEEARRRGYPAVAFQAGEVESEANTAYYERLLAKCRGLEVTLSLGEQTEDVYRRWKDAGAMRYLIRIETSDRRLYAKIHPADCSFERRVACIRTLKALGYVTGTGVMIGLPGQTVEDLARDIVFFGDEKADMVGMGPYVPHAATPLAAGLPSSVPCPRLLDLSCRMIALTRLYLHDVNIVAATALSALDPFHGRDRGIDAGANVVMPNLTPLRYRCDYALYPGKSEAVS